MSIAVTESWDVEYATGTRYTPDEPPVGFVADILGEIQVPEFVRVVLLFEVDLGFFQDLDARAVKVGKEIFELAAGVQVLCEQLVHFVV